MPTKWSEETTRAVLDVCVRARARAHSPRAIEQRWTEALGNNDKNFGREKLIFNVSDNWTGLNGCWPTGWTKTSILKFNIDCSNAIESNPVHTHTPFISSNSVFWLLVFHRNQITYFVISLEFLSTSSLLGSTALAAIKYDLAFACCPNCADMHPKLFSAAPCEPSELKHKRRHRRARLKSPLVCRK